MKRRFTALLSAAVLLLSLCSSVFASGDAKQTTENTTNTVNASIFSWDLHLLSAENHDQIRNVLQTLHITRVYQCLPAPYLEQTTTADMVKRMTQDGVEIAALIGEREWGLRSADLQDVFAYIDALVRFNETLGKEAPIRKLAIDVETYTLDEWSRSPKTYFADYIKNMRSLYDYAHGRGFSVIQIIPVHFDRIDAALFRGFVEQCCDELSLMNYTKKTQVTAIRDEVALCRELGMRVETIFETMPTSDKYSVTKDNTYFYDGLDALHEKAQEILTAYQYDGLTLSYHYFRPIYHMLTGKYIAEIYAYTDSADPTRNDLGQTDALPSLTLRGSDSSTVKAYLYNPNLGAEYPEVCYLVFGVAPDVTYTIVADSPEYAVQTSEKTFSFEEDALIDYTSLKLTRVGESAQPRPESEPSPETGNDPENGAETMQDDDSETQEPAQTQEPPCDPNCDRTPKQERRGKKNRHQ